MSYTSNIDIKARTICPIQVILILKIKTWTTWPTQTALTWRLPLGQYSVTIQTLGISIHTPTKVTRLSWFISRSWNRGQHALTHRHHTALQWRHNGRDGVSNHQPHDCLLNRLFRRRSNKTPKLRVTGLCAGKSPVTGEFPAQMASNAENISIWWRHHGEMFCILWDRIGGM